MIGYLLLVTPTDEGPCCINGSISFFTFVFCKSIFNSTKSNTLKGFFLPFWREKCDGETSCGNRPKVLNMEKAATETIEECQHAERPTGSRIGGFLAGQTRPLRQILFRSQQPGRSGSLNGSSYGIESFCYGLSSWNIYAL